MRLVSHGPIRVTPNSKPGTSPVAIPSACLVGCLLPLLYHTAPKHSNYGYFTVIAQERNGPWNR